MTVNWKKVGRKAKRTALKIDDDLNHVLDKTRRKPVETHLLPVAAFGGLTLEAINLGHYVQELVAGNQQDIVNKVGSFGYAFADTVLPAATTLAAVPFVAVPAAVGLWRHFNRKRPKHGNGIVPQTLEVLTENPIVNNPVVLPGLAITGLAHLAYSLGTNADTALQLLEAGVFGVTGLKSGMELFDYFSKNRPRIPSRGRLSSKTPLAYMGAAFFSIAAPLSATGLVDKIIPKNIFPDFDWPSLSWNMPDVDPTHKGKIKRGTETYNFVDGDKLTLWDAAGYFAEMYSDNKIKVDPDLVRAMLWQESEFSHWEEGGRQVKKSPKGAVGISQQMPINYRELNRVVRSGELSGKEFDWSDITDDPAENIRACAATVRLYMQRCVPKDEDCEERVLASYNAGSGNVEDAFRAAGLRDIWKDDFWDAFSHLPAETRTYVRRIMPHRYILKEGLTWPTKKTDNVTSRFGKRTDPITGEREKFHNGMDLGANKPGKDGDDIYAITSGEVIESANGHGYGNYVLISHGKKEWGFTSMSGHLSDRDVSEGKEVKMGKDIGDMGSTGRSTATHLHLNVDINSNGSIINEKHTDPLRLYHFYQGNPGDAQTLIKIDKAKYSENRDVEVETIYDIHRVLDSPKVETARLDLHEPRHTYRARRFVGDNNKDITSNLL